MTESRSQNKTVKRGSRSVFSPPVNIRRSLRHRRGLIQQNKICVLQHRHGQGQAHPPKRMLQQVLSTVSTSLHPVDSSETGSFSLASSKPTCKSETSTLPFDGCKLPRMKRLTFSRVSRPASFTPISCQDRRLTLYTRTKQQIPVTKAHQQATCHSTW